MKSKGQKTALLPYRLFSRAKAALLLTAALVAALMCIGCSGEKMPEPPGVYDLSLMIPEMAEITTQTIGKETMTFEFADVEIEFTDRASIDYVCLANVWLENERYTAEAQYRFYFQFYQNDNAWKLDYFTQTEDTALTPKEK